jgi:membrane-bound inhibitor of C-type lysozyme
MLKNCFLLCSLFAASALLPAHAKSETAYSCEEGAYSFTLKNISRGKVLFSNAVGDKETLRQVPAGSGTLYKNKSYEVHLKGNEGFVVFNKKYRHNDCKVVKN